MNTAEKCNKFLKKIARRNHVAVDKLSQLWNGDNMPDPLKSCFAYLFCYKLEATLIFRKSGNKVAQEVIVGHLKKNKPIVFYDTSEYDVSSALKAYIKDIPDGLMLKSFTNEWHKIAKLSNGRFKEKLTNLIQRLPDANRNLLFHLLLLADALMERKTHNEMSARSLSIVLMPSMFENVVEITKVKHLNMFYDLLEYMIVNAKEIIDEYVYSVIETSLREMGEKLEVISNRTEDKLEYQKRIQFISQDSGLNSTSFLDDKTSQSMSTCSQARDNNTSSMEDLLNTVEASQPVYLPLHSVSVKQPETSISCASLLPNSSSQESILSTFSDKDDCCGGVCSCKSCNKRIVDNIKESRPISYCGSQFSGDPIDYIINMNYTPVYADSFRTLGISSKPIMNESMDSSLSTRTPTAQPTVQRKKGVTKTSSFLNKTNGSGSSTATVTCTSAANTTTVSPSNSLRDSTIGDMHTMKRVRSRIRKKPGSKIRLSAPLRCPSINYREETALLGSLPHQMACLQQKSSHETFV